MVDWFIDENEEINISHKSSFVLPIPRRLSAGILKRLIDTLQNKRIKIVSYTVAVPGYVLMFSRQKILRTLLLKKGFTVDELEELNYFRLPIKVN